MLWVKGLHVISMVTWFAGLFYLPRLFVYHALAQDGLSQQRFVVMEHKLFWYIMTPGAVVTCALGGWLLWGYAWAAYGQSLWLPLKLLMVGLLWVYHVVCGLLLRDFARGRNAHSHRWYRVFNEAPTLLLVGIVLLVVVKPF
jgi:putative membrane protein